MASNKALKLEAGLMEELHPYTARKQFTPLPEKEKKERTNELTKERTKERKNERTKVHHSFDIYKDQLLSLKEISLESENISGERKLIGDLVQEALDMFISGNKK